MLREKLSEGDYIMTEEGYVFEVKGMRHKGGWYTAYLKYKHTKREKLKIYPIGERFAEVIKHARKYLWYDESICRMSMRVVLKDAIETLKAQEAYTRLKNHGAKSRIGEATLKMAKILEDNGVSKGSIGVSGSVSLGIEHEDSDIDIVVYGEKEGRLAYTILSELRADGVTQPLSEEIVRRKYASMRARVDYSLFKERETSRVLQGMFDGVEYSIRLVDEGTPEFKAYIPIRRVEGVYEVLDDRYSVFTPMWCEVEVIEGASASGVFSLRMRDTEAARSGDMIYVSGHLELCVTSNGIATIISLNDDYSYIVPGYAVEDSR